MDFLKNLKRSKSLIPRSTRQVLQEQWHPSNTAKSAEGHPDAAEPDAAKSFALYMVTKTSGL